MTGQQENFQVNDGASHNNNVVDSTAKCLFADAYSGDKMPYDPNMQKNEKFPNGGKLGDELQKLPHGKPGIEEMNKLPEAHLEKLPKDKFPGGKLEQMPGKLPYGEKDKFPNKMEGELEKYPDKMEGQLEKYPNKMEGKLDKNGQIDKNGTAGQFGDKMNRKNEISGGGFKDGEGYGGGGFKDGSQGGGSFGKDLEKHGSGKSSLGPIDKNSDGTVDGTEKQFDKNGNDILDEHEGLNKKILPPLDRGASGTLPSVGEIAPDINTWSRLERNGSVERGGSGGRRGYNEAVPAEQTRRQYRNY